MQDNRQQTIEFKFTGLDQDSDQRLMAPGDSRYRLNCINDSTDDGLLGDIQNIKGNTLYSHTPPTGKTFCIGSCKDIENNAIIYFNYNVNGFHQIRRFFPDTGVDQLILEDPLLNFQENQRIYGANVINGLLYWTDGWFESYEYDINNLLQFNPPRKINIEKARTGGYTPLTFEDLDRIKYQPNTPATLRYIYDPAQIENYLYGKMVQVTYRYIFDDKEVSTWATLSQVLLPIYSYKNNNPFELFENTVGVTLQSGSEIVTEIEIAVRGAIQNVDGAQSYFIISRLNKAELSIPDNSSYEFIYNGLAYKENLPSVDFLRPFDYVPQISKCQDIVGGRITDADIVEDYDNVDTIATGEYIRYDKTLSIRTTSPDVISPLNPNNIPWGTSVDNQYPIPTFKQLGLYQYGFVYYDRAGRSGVVNTKDEYLLLAPSIDQDIANPMAGMLGDPLKMRLSIDSAPPSWATHWAPVITKDLRYIKKKQFVVTTQEFDVVAGNIKLPPEVNYSLDDGDYIRLISGTKSQEDGSGPVGLLSFFNSVSNAGIFSHNEMLSQDFNLPFTDSISTMYTQAVCGFNYKIQDFVAGNIKISPEDAIDMQNYVAHAAAFAVTDPLQNVPFSHEIAWSQHWFILEIYNVNRDTTENKVFFEIGEKFEIGNPNLAARYHKAPFQDQVIGSLPAIVDVYGFDCYLRRKKSVLDNKIIFLQNIIFTPLYGKSDIYTVASGAYISFIETYLPAFNGADLNNINIIMYDSVNNFSSQVNYLPFTLFQNNQYSYLKQNGGSFVPNLPNNTFIDFWGIFFRANQTVYPWIECDDFSDDYPSTTYNDGRVNSNLEILGRKQYISRIRWSGKLFENTLINELSTVLAVSYVNLSEKYNNIHKIREVGDTLKVRQKNKLTSFYIDKEMLNVNKGSDNVGQSDEFLSAPNIYEEFYGTSSPGSDSQAIRTGYFLDLLNGVVIRDAGNKPLPISGDDDNAQDPFKMAKYFRDLCKAIRTAGEENFSIISCWDEFSSLYTFTVEDLRETPLLSQTIVFHEPTNRWKSFMSYVPEWYETLGKSMVAFKAGQPYLHYTNALRNNFFGVQYGQEIRVVANIGRNTIKVFQNLDVYSNIAWEIPTINIPATANYPNGMLSSIPAARFVAKEGVWHAPFLRDKNDPKYSNSAIIALLNGRRLRGETIELVMTNPETGLVYFKALNIYVTPSEETI